MTNFTPGSALAGGTLVGLAAVLLLALNGRIAGVSSIATGLLYRRAGETGWRFAFLGGLVSAVLVYYALGGGVPSPRPGFPAWLLALSGVLVGYGTALGSGCTSGHGVCGLGRLSLRSLAATAVFLVTAIAATFVVRHVFGVIR